MKVVLHLLLFCLLSTVSTSLSSPFIYGYTFFFCALLILLHQTQVEADFCCPQCDQIWLEAHLYSLYFIFCYMSGEQSRDFVPHSWVM